MVLHQQTLHLTKLNSLFLVLSYHLFQTQNTLSDADKVLVNVNETKLKAGDLVSEVQAMVMTIQSKMSH